MNSKIKKYVLTGGPGTGKTTVLEILSLRGYNIISETAREIIKIEQEKDSDILPWKNAEKFQIVVAENQYEKEKTLKEGNNFLDRGLIDGYAYCEYENVPIPKIITANGINQYDKIFLLEQLPVYQNDENRKENKESADLVHKIIRESYVKFGYELINVPVLPPNERVDFILSKL